MINGRRSLATQLSPVNNVLTINQPANICGAPINSTVNVPIIVTSDPLPLPNNAAVDWGGSVELVEGDQALSLSAPNQFRMRICVIAKAAVTVGGSNINVSNVFAVGGTNPRPTVRFTNMSGWVKLKVYATDGYTVVHTDDIIVGTSSAQCQAALGVATN